MTRTLPLALLALLAGCSASGTQSGPAPVPSEPSPAESVVVASSALRTLLPDPAQAKYDVPGMYARGCQQNNESAAVLSCTWGSRTAATTIAVVGDSKAAQWTTAIERMVPKQNWRVVSYTKSACDFADVDQDLRPGTAHPTCRPWVRSVLRKLTGPERPDWVVLSQRGTRAGDDRNDVPAQRERMRRAMLATWTRLSAAGIRIAVIADNPEPAKQVHDCVAGNPRRLDRCEFDRAAGIARSAAPLQRQVAEAMGGTVRYLDLVDRICPAKRCRPTSGEVLVYRQGSHLTATYVATLTQPLLTLLEGAGVPARRRGQPAG
ncbi:MAG: SGNH hydrolase domain-containing protein [Sporichthyaceae bacterium]